MDLTVTLATRATRQDKLPLLKRQPDMAIIDSNATKTDATKTDPALLKQFPSKANMPPTNQSRNIHEIFINKQSISYYE